MQLALLMIICLLPASLSANDSAWLQLPPSKWSDAADRLEISETSVMEVVHSKVAHALQMLESKSAAPLTGGQAELFSGRSLELQEGNVYVLVRCLFGHGATGGYTVIVSADGGQLLVGHLSLGTAISATKSALVLQLKRVPKTVFGSVSFAR